MKRILISFLVLLFVFTASVSFAQQTGPCPTDDTTTATNPTHLCFTASVDHNAEDLGVQRIDRYDVMYFGQGVDPATGAPVQTVQLGKPAPNAQNAIWLQRAELGTMPIGQQFRAVVVAVGPNGTSARSSASNPFGRTTSAAPAAPASVRVVRP